MTTITHLVMTLPADKLALFVEACEQQERTLALAIPDQYLKFSEQIQRGGAVARLLLKFRNDLQDLRQRQKSAEAE